MIVQVSKQESAALVMHMTVMRKSVRNKLKASHKAEQKKWLAAYDYVKESATNALQSEQEQSELNLNIRDVEILEEFIRAYKAEIAKDKALDKIFNEQDKQSLELLTSVQDRCRELLQ